MPSLSAMLRVAAKSDCGICGGSGWDQKLGVFCVACLGEERVAETGDCTQGKTAEAIKGGLSDAMKRAAVQWGIGRYLYNLGETFADCSAEKQPGWNYAKTKDGQVFYWKTPVLPKWALPAGTTPPRQDLPF